MQFRRQPYIKRTLKLLIRILPRFPAQFEKIVYTLLKHSLQFFNVTQKLYRFLNLISIQLISEVPLPGSV